jgi:hypothetical protein
MKKCLFVILALLPLIAIAQPKVKKLTPKKIPSEVDYLGDVVLAIQWKDNVGENIVVFTQTAPAQNKDRPEKDLFEASVDARHYVLIEDHWRPRWNVHDQVNECGLKISANYEIESIDVTDIDEDGIGEVWMLYKIGCHGPDRPAYMKVIMYESETRYSIKGLSDAKIGQHRGDYTIDPSFTNGPADFRDYAIELWNIYLTNERRLYKVGSFKY